MGGAQPPSGTVTFLFTDIEESTPRWEADAERMQASLSHHDDVLHSAIDGQGGVVFRHTGDGVCAAFHSAAPAFAAAVAAQQRLELPVRMGIATGDVALLDGDYRGPILNRVARVMDAGHGGQILVADATAVLLDRRDMMSLGKHALRGVEPTIELFQIVNQGLRESFPGLRTQDLVPGNLPRSTGPLIGRGRELAELQEVLDQNRLVTLTGVGGVGKTRLALELAREATTLFADGVWIVELASVTAGDAVPDAIASTLSTPRRANHTVTDCVADALAQRRLLLVLDNGEHVLDAVWEVIETILARSSRVKAIVTSREVIGNRAERVWRVPSLDTTAERDSPAVRLLVQRASEINPDFVVDGIEDVLVEICRTLDGIALAIELAAARLVSMSANDVLDRLDDRFRLLSSGPRRHERHQTLDQAIAWSFDLLPQRERELLSSCSVFVDGFDVAAATHVGQLGDDYETLDLLDSLVRKSLVVLRGENGRQSRYRILETIRQFANQVLLADVEAERGERHARYFAGQAVANWELACGAGSATAIEWIEAELANLRAAFRWSVQNDHTTAAATIAAHAAMLAFIFERLEPASWAEEILPAAVARRVNHLPRVATAAAFCALEGRPEDGLRYAEIAVSLEGEPSLDSFEPGWSSIWQASCLAYLGRFEEWIEISRDLVGKPGLQHVAGLCGLVYLLPVMHQAAEARSLASEAMVAARSHGNPYWTAMAVGGVGRAFAKSDPERALGALREGVAAAREQRIDYWHTLLTQELARLEATHGEVARAARLFEDIMDAFHQAGNVTHLAMTFRDLAVFFGRIAWRETAATLFGAGAAVGGIAAEVPSALVRTRDSLGASMFDELADSGSRMDLSVAVQFAHQELGLVNLQR